MSATRARQALPDVAHVTALPATLTVTAPPEWEDHNGHVNVAAYYQFHLRAAEHAFEAFGVDAGYLERHGESVFTVEQHLSFYDEVLVGHEVSAYFLVLDRSAKLLHALSILVDHTTGRIANALEFVEAHVDLTTRRACPFQPEVAARLDALVAEQRQLEWEFPLSGSMGLRGGTRS